MLAYVPVRFDLYRTVRPALRWTLQCLVSFADRSGKCFPSVRKLAEHAGLSKSTASRHLAQLAGTGIISRKRRPGGVYTYLIDSRFLPAARGVSQARPAAVPSQPTKENPIKRKGDSRSDLDSSAAEPPLSPAERAERVRRLDAVIAGLMAKSGESGRRASRTAI